MSYVDIANEESSGVQIDGEDYYVALRNLENKYGYDENSFHKMEGRCNEIISATTLCEVQIKSILEKNRG